MKSRILGACFLIFAGSIANAAEPSIYIDLTNPEMNGVFPYMDSSKCQEIDFSVNHKIRKKCISNRSYSTKGDTINVYIRHFDDSNPVPVFDEVKRKSRINENLKVLVKIIDAVVGNQGGAAADPGQAREIIVSKYTHILSNTRATLSVEVVLPNAGSDDQDDQGSIKIQTTTGPKEHWFLSADILVTESNQLSYDSENNSLVERTKPSEFFVGANYQFGDLLSDENNMLENMYLKLFVKASSRPLDSYGLGIGYAFNNVGSVFLAYNRFLEDGDPEGSSIPSKEYGDSFGVGISLSIDSAIGWLGN